MVRRFLTTSACRRPLHILYMPTGSLARGDDTPESDLDIYIETVSLSRQQHQIISDILWEIGFENGVVIAPIIFSREDIENGPLLASPIYKAIMREGIPV